VKKTTQKSAALSRRDLMGAAAAVAAFTFVPKRVEWDAKTLRSPNCPEADNYVTKFYRTGWYFDR
jgi:hypothetical protein